MSQGGPTCIPVLQDGTPTWRTCYAPRLSRAAESKEHGPTPSGAGFGLVAGSHPVGRRIAPVGRPFRRPGEPAFGLTSGQHPARVVRVVRGQPQLGPGSQNPRELG